MNLAQSLQNTLQSLPENITLIAVSKTRTPEEIMEMYQAGQREFGENKVQELTEKYKVLPKDIRWHQIGHLQKNKVKYIAPFVDLIQSVDSKELLDVIQKEAIKNNRNISVLLEIKIAREDSKYGLTFEEAISILEKKKLGSFPNIDIKGLMGMASFIDDKNQIKKEFTSLYNFYIEHNKESHLSVLSMGMSDDYPIAIECGSSMVRIGSKLFGKRNYNLS